jgi:bacterioferritin-associated ferredoxin
MDKSTIVCRCEEITVADIEDAVAQGAETFDDVKRLTRSGMGLCQAKTCHTVIAALIAELTHKSIGDLGVPRLRMPLRPVAMDVFATAQSREQQES